MTINDLYQKLYKFDLYMTDERCDRLGESGMYKDDLMRAVSGFIEFIETGSVTLDDDECDE